MVSKPVSDAFYITLNPVKKELMKRSKSLLTKGTATNDRDIIRRMWLLIDLDAERKSVTSATDAEHQAAHELGEKIRTELSSRGWPEPVTADSGNGMHLLYRIDEKTDDDNLIEDCLESLAQEFSTEQVKVDRSVHNASRICKLYGTWAKKGDNTEERPHRISKLLHGPKYNRSCR